MSVPSPIALHEPVKDADAPDPDEDVTKLEGLNDHDDEYPEGADIE